MSKIEFGIHKADVVGDRLIVEGRCYNGPISTSDEFTAVYRLVPQKTSDGFGESERTDNQAVSLVVESIEAYGSRLDQVDSGLTARLELSGEGTDQVTENMVLGRD